MTSSLRDAGIVLEFNRPDHSGRRIVSIRLMTSTPKSLSAPSALSAEPREA